MVTDAQVRLMRQKRMEGKTQVAAAAAAGMSERTARAWEQGPLPSATKKPRAWRTREDPLAEVWDTAIVPLLEADEKGVLSAGVLLETVAERCPGRLAPGVLRTLQRRVRDWRALRGPERDVVFPQEHPPGREGALDFTHGTELDVTVGGAVFPHLLFVFRLSHSGWTWASLAFGETFEALVKGLQDALWALGGVPAVVRHDNLSAATHELKLSGGRALNTRFRDVLDHYDLTSTRIRPGKPQENGGAEKAGDLVKRALAQGLVLRGSAAFTDVDAYRVFVDETLARLNRPAREALLAERELLRPLPTSRVPDYTTFHAHVRRWSTVRVAGRGYSVPSRLIGHEVEVRQHADEIEILYGGKLVERMPRLRGESEVRIDYRHIIWALVRKPGAFARYKYREELFPSLTFRRAYDRLCAWRGERADVEYVRILHLAAGTVEAHVERALAELLESGQVFDYVAVKALAHPEATPVPEVRIPAPDLSAYDRLLGVAP